MWLLGSEDRRGGVCRQFFGPFAAGACTNQGRRPMPLAQRDSRSRLAFAKVSQPGGARYGGGCNPDATRMQPGCNSPKVLQPGGGRGACKVLQPGRPEATACNELDGPRPKKWPEVCNESSSIRC
jgi:hypothetical protein